MLLDLVEKFTETRCWEEVSREVENPENVGLRTGVGVKVRQRELRIRGRQTIYRMDCETTSFSGEDQAEAAARQLSDVFAQTSLPDAVKEKIASSILGHELRGHALNDLPMVRREGNASFVASLVKLGLGGQAYIKYGCHYLPDERTPEDALRLTEGPGKLSSSDKKYAAFLRKLRG